MRNQNVISSCRGFSLLEIVVAFSIAAMTLSIIFQIYSKGTRSTLLGNEYAEAIIIAESQLAEMNSSELLELANVTKSEQSIYSVNLTVDDYIEPAEEDTSVSVLEYKRVEVSVNWSSAGQEREVKLVTLKPFTVNGITL